MAAPHDTLSMALFCDFENVALGVRDANFDKFDIKPILERLLLKGSIVVKKAYCDWDRYKTFKAAMHEANFELIEIPHVRQSGKNSADIRLVVDALDLCYTKSHVNTFVIISGDSDFSPLVSKLRENAKQVIGVGVKQSTSDLLIANCDEFIFYDDLVRETRRTEASREKNNKNPNAGKKQPDENKGNREELEARKSEAIEMAIETFDALISERGDSGKIWASVLKNAIKRRKPDFNEGNYGFRTFGSLLEEAQARGQLQLSRDDKSGTYVYRSNTVPAPASESTPETGHAVVNTPVASQQEQRPYPQEQRQNPRRNGRGNRNEYRSSVAETSSEEPAAAIQTADVQAADVPASGTASENSAPPASDWASYATMPSAAESATDFPGHAPVSHSPELPSHATTGNDAPNQHGSDAAAATEAGDTGAVFSNTPGAEAMPRETRQERGRRTQTGRRPVKPKNKTASAHETSAATTPIAPPAAASVAPVTATLPTTSSYTDKAATPVLENKPTSASASEPPAANPDTAPASAKKRSPRPARPRKTKASDSQDSRTDLPED